MPTQIVRLVTRDSDGSLRIRDFKSADDLLRSHEQIGVDDCSTDLELRGLPVFRGLVGPIPEAKGIARYETPDVFEHLTKEWSKAKVKRRRRRSSAVIAAENAEATTAVPVPIAEGMSAGFGSMVQS